MEYLIDNSKYNLSYKELKEHYEKYANCQDEIFINEIIQVLHLSCFICWFKEIPSIYCLSDKGIIHELIHLIEFKDYNNIKEIRELFNRTCKLI